MIDDLVKPLWKGIADIDQQQEAAATIEALRARVKAADELAERFEQAIAELGEYNVELYGEDYNCPAHNEALAAYRATDTGAA
jgi:hypothetical protein